MLYLYLSPGSGRRLSENCGPAKAKPSISKELLLLPAGLATPSSAGPHLRRSCALLRPASLHKRVPDAFWAPFWDPLDFIFYAPVEARA